MIDYMKVVDNFVESPDEVRQSALIAGLGTWRPNKGEVGSSIYDGMGFWGHHAVMVKGIVRIMDRPIYPNSMFFRVTNENTESAYVHSDRETGDLTCLVYLSKHEGLSGTGFYRHRESGFIRMPSFAQLATMPKLFEKLKVQMVKGSDEDWEQVNFVDGKYNRAVIFDAPRFHARTPKHGFGSSVEDGRMVWACHFYM
jgi:hypothetical protein